MLKREVGIFGAMFMGLGSIIGTGVFVSIGIGAGVTGPSVILAIFIAGLIATCNGLSSAQLAANHPVSGGTYEYAHRWLSPSLGFTAGAMFLCAKSASAATAALGFSGYALNLFNLNQSILLVPVAIGVVLLTTLLVLGGIRRSNIVNIVIVSITLLTLGIFVIAGLLPAFQNGTENLSPFFIPAVGESALVSFLEASALMFVAFTGYGRIATLGEEVIDPRKSIPRAMIATLTVSTLLYIAVSLVGIAAVGSKMMAAATFGKAAALKVVAGQFGSPIVGKIVAIGAVMAMLGVLLNLILGLSRVALAMGRRGDLHLKFAKVNQAGTTPYVAVIAVGILIASLTGIGNIKITWSLSAFTVLIYYAITNLCAIQLSESERLYPKFIPWFGFVGCLSLAFWVDTQIWIFGLALIIIGHLARMLLKKRS